MDAKELTLENLRVADCQAYLEQMPTKPRAYPAPNHMSRQHCPNKQELATELEKKRYRTLTSNMCRKIKTGR
jgi:hypothetical protein